MSNATSRLQDLIAMSLAETAQLNGNVVDAKEIMLDAFHTDAHTLVAQARKEMDASPDPLAAH